MPPRYDVSAVPLQGAYVAKQCPVRAQNDVLQPGQPSPSPPFLERLFRRGRHFEVSVIEDLLEASSDAAVITGHGEQAEADTDDAMRRGVPLILGARLPSDLSGRRVGKPDLVIRAAAGGYRAVDMKNHMAQSESPARKEWFAPLFSQLDQPALESARLAEDRFPRRNQSDVLQLAHYQRMLEARGFAAGDGRWGGIIGAERVVVWYDLDLPVWSTPSLTEGSKLRTTMERYDFEFDFRLDIMAVAQAHQADSSVPLLVLPVNTGECESCPWRDVCRVELKQGWGDVSLLPRVGYEEWRAHRTHGVTDRAMVAALDYRTATVVSAGVDPRPLTRAAKSVNPDLPVSEWSEISDRDARRLGGAGVVTLDEVRSLDPRTAEYADTPMSSLPLQIDLARASLGDRPVYRRREVDALSIPRFDVEIDIDMENVDEGCYLWGALLTARSPGGVTSEFRHFVTWDPLNPEVEAANTARLWTWLTDSRAACLATGRTFGAFCYNAAAENQILRRMGMVLSREDEVADLLNSDQWVDMLRVWTTQLITGGPSGLKRVAPIAGFHWPVEDPGGALSMLKYDEAIGDGPPAESARSWLIDYNRGDVEATLALRDWLDANAHSIPSITTLDP